MADTPTIEVFNEAKGTNATIRNTPEELATAKSKGYAPRQELPPPPLPQSVLHPTDKLAGQVSRMAAVPTGLVGSVGKAVTGSDPIQHPGPAAGVGAAMLASLLMGPELGLAARSAITGGSGALGYTAASEHPTLKGAAGTALLAGPGMEIPSSLISKLATRLFTGRLGTLPGGRLPDEPLVPARFGQVASDWSKRYLNFRGVSGRALKEEITTRAGQDIIDIAQGGGPLAPFGQSVKDTLLDVTKPAFQKIAADMVGDLKMATQGIEVNTLPLQLTAQQLRHELMQVSQTVDPQLVAAALQGGVNPPILNTALPATESISLLRDISKLPEKADFMQLFELRKRWWKATTEPYLQQGIKPPAIYRKIYGELTQAMDTAAAIDPAANTIWQEFRNNYAEDANLLHSRLLKYIAQRDPEQVAKNFGKNAETPAKQLVRALVGIPEEYARRFPGPDSAAAVTQGQQALHNFRIALIRTKLSDGGVFKLSQHLNDMGDTGLTTLFGGDAEGKALLSRVRSVADRLDYLSTIQAPQLATYVGYLRGIPSQIMSHILANPQLSKLYMTGLNGLIDSNSRAKGPMLAASHIVTDRTARYFAQIGRAWYLAEHPEDMKPLASHLPTLLGGKP